MTTSSTSSTASKTVQLAQALIRQPSVTPADADCQAMMIKRLEVLGFDCQSLRFGEGKENGPVDNLWAVKEGTRGSDAPLFCFAGHTDVVPVGDKSQWQQDPFAATIEGDMLLGRGAADMKGSLAAMIVAVENFIQQQPEHKNRIAFLITSDEEGPAEFGTKAVMDYLATQNEAITWCLVGEPSSTSQLGDVIKNGRRGSLNGYLTIKGIQGHVAYPHLAENPIHLAAPLLTELSEREWDEGDAFFPPTSFQVSNINSGTGATNVIPGDIKIVLNFRYSTQWAAEALQAEVEKLLNNKDLNFELRWDNSGKPFITESGELVDAALAAIQDSVQIEAQLLTTGGTSDGRFIAPSGAQVVELGPINATIHKTNECVSCSDLDKLTTIYTSILQKLL